ncbi:hypothetical protein, partial [Escherichia coli]|uniref:hypothetical protein n=1 Tax=Escherichia coli TaxID=562 RepID=UPI00215A6B9D
MNNNYNRNLILNLDSVFTNYGKQANVPMLSAMVNGITQILDFNAKYYDKITPTAELLPLKKKVVEQTKGWLGIEGGKGV